MESEDFERQQSAASETDIKQAQEAVTKLLWFSNHYFEHHGVECAARKEEDVRQQMQETTSLLSKLQGSLPKVQYLHLRGKALNVLSEHSPEAQQCLSQAIKHDPSLVDAWNALGECYWKAGNVQQAYDCFAGALMHSKNKESLRNMSMVLRQMGKDATERESKVKESVEKAKEAVAMDVKDGISWMILGNAYLSLFFSSQQDSKVLKQCVSAYSQAEKDPVAANNPDLHFNKATLCQFEEDFVGVLRELSLASALDPGWTVAREKREETRVFLRSLANLIASKGKLKAKKLSTLVASVATPDKHLGSYAGNKTPVIYSELAEGENVGKVFVGGVVALITTKDRVAYCKTKFRMENLGSSACVLVDGMGGALGVTVYNLAATAHFTTGDVLTIPDPLLCHTSTLDEGEAVEFWNIRVTNPMQLLLNGQKLSLDKVAPSTISITTFS